MANELLVVLVNPLLEALRAYVPAVLRTNELNVAMPLEAPTLVEMPVGLDVSKTVAEELDTRLPFASWTCTTTAVMVEPEVVPTGWVVKATLLAAPAEMVKELLEALVNPLLAAARVYVPTVLRTRPVNVATPLTAATLVDIPAGLDVNVTVAVEVVTTLPLELRI